jgi:hypothetical protein
MIVQLHPARNFFGRCYFERNFVLPMTCPYLPDLFPKKSAGREAGLAEVEQVKLESLI